MYNRNQHLHFVGIGGVGMAGLAEVLHDLGYSISGSDLKESALTEILAASGAKIFFGHDARNVLPETAVVIYSSAVAPDNCELLEARARTIPIIPRAEMLAELMRMKYGIAVAGAHGKTTTTSLTAKLLTDMGLDPTVLIGGRVLSEATGAKLGHGEYLVAEADESDGSFCLLKPAIAIVTNIDTEHLSFYGSLGAVEQAFLSFMQAVPFYGLVVANGDDPLVRNLAAKLSRRVCYYGFSAQCEVAALNIRTERSARHSPSTCYDLYLRGEFATTIALPMLGRHMVSNSLAAIAVAMELGAFPQELAHSLSEFPGVARRSEKIADVNGVLVLDDYGHHPNEIRATLRAIRESYLDDGAGVAEERGRLFVVFQPHRYSRTRELFSDFVSAFGDADLLYLGEIYSAGEPAIDGVSGESLARSMQHSAVKFVPDFSDALREVVPQLKPGDVVLTLGAGNVSQVAPQLKAILENR